MGILLAASGVGMSVGPAVGGVLTDALGIRAPFIAVGAVSLLTSLYTHLRFDETLATLSAAVQLLAARAADGAAEPRRVELHALPRSRRAA
jgi:MFS family permease